MPAHARSVPPLALLASLIPAVAACWSAAQPADAPVDTEPATGLVTPTLKQIMSDPEWVARSPSNIAWSWDGRSVLFDRQREGSRLSDRWRVAAREGSNPTVIPDEQLPSASAGNGVLSADRTRRAFARSGDLFVRDMASGELTQLTRTVAGESSPLWMADGSLAFRRGGAWIVRDLETGIERQAAEIRAEDDLDDEDKKKDKEYLETQQERLFAIVRDREAREEERDARRKARREADATRVPGPFYLGEGWRIHERALSPSGSWMALTVSKDPGDAKRDEMPAYVNEDGYVSSSRVRAKVGIEKGRSDSVVLIDLEAERVHWMDASELPTITDDPLAWLKEADDEEADSNVKDAKGAEEEQGADTAEAAAAEEEEEEEEGQESDSKPAPRPFVVEQVEWSPDGTGVFFVLHSNDNKDRWIATADLEALADLSESGDPDEPEASEPDETEPDAGKPKLTTIHHLRDEAWINWYFNEMAWLADSSGVWFLSEESGYSHLCLWDRASGETRALTAGYFTVQDVVEYERRNMLLYRCNFFHPGQYEIGWASLKPSDEVNPTDFSVLTEFGGTVEAFEISPDGSRVAMLYSTAMDPPEIYVQGLSPITPAFRLTDTDTDLYRSFDWVEPRFVEVPSSHTDDPIHCRVYDDPGVPAPSDAGKPVVLFSHGAGYTQHVYNGWSYYFREHMFHTLLCRNGYIVIAPDFRASRGYGRDWRTAIYRDMGRPELEDFSDCIVWLDDSYDRYVVLQNRAAQGIKDSASIDEDSRYGLMQSPVDRHNVGIYGGSYGGFMTLMAMFLRPEVYDCGAALRPVTDWAHYNHSYTSNILNTPEVDPEAYERSSPIEHAEGLAGALLMCHGMLDDNVVAQDTIRLAQRLIELEKENWEMALYPVEPHGFREPTGWLDEYRRIFKLFETHLKD